MPIILEKNESKKIKEDCIVCELQERQPGCTILTMTDTKQVFSALTGDHQWNNATQHLTFKDLD